MRVPCKDCPDRHPLCHSDCERYKAYREDVDRRRTERQAEAGGWMSPEKQRAFRKKLNDYKKYH